MVVNDDVQSRDGYNEYPFNLNYSENDSTSGKIVCDYVTVDCPTMGNKEANFWDVCKSALNLFLFNMVFLIFSNSQMTVLLSFVNRKYHNDINLITAIGTVNTMFNLLLYPQLIAMSTILEILGSQAYGVLKLNLFGCYINKARFFGYILILLFGFTMLCFHGPIFHYWGVSTHSLRFTYQILFLRTFSAFFEFETFLMMRYIQIVGKGTSAIFVLIFNGIQIPIYCHWLIERMNLHSYGCGIFYICNNLVLSISIWCFVLIKCYDKQVLFFINKETFYHLPHFFVVYIPLYLLSLMDNINPETMAVYASYFDKSAYSAFINAYSLYNLFGTVPTAFSVTANIIMSTAISQDRNGRQTLRTFYFLLVIALFIGGIVCVLNYLCMATILDLVVARGDIYYITERMFSLSILCNYADLINAIYSSTFKAIGFINLSFGVYILGNFLNISGIFLFAFQTKLHIFGIFYAYFINNLGIILLYCLSFYFLVDFKSCADDINRAITEDEDKEGKYKELEKGQL